MSLVYGAIKHILEKRGKEVEIREACERTA